jgi:hypothetical protein
MTLYQTMGPGLESVKLPDRWNEYSSVQAILTGGSSSPREELATLSAAVGHKNKDTYSILFIPWTSRDAGEDARDRFNQELQHEGFGSLIVSVAPSRAALMGALSNWKDGYFEKLTQAEKTAVRQHDRLLREPRDCRLSAEEQATIKRGVDFRSAFLRQLADADILYVGSGSQQRMMDVIRHQDLLEAIRMPVLSGDVVYAGTSAGSAITATHMFAGGSVAQGLSLLPPHLAVDQHLDRGARMLRFIEGMQAEHYSVGIGLYEGTTGIIRDGHFTVVGGNKALFVTKFQGSLQLQFLGVGESTPL